MTPDACSPRSIDPLDARVGFDTFAGFVARAGLDGFVARAGFAACIARARINACAGLRLVRAEAA